MPTRIRSALAIALLLVSLFCACGTPSAGPYPVEPAPQATPKEEPVAAPPLVPGAWQVPTGLTDEQLAETLVVGRYSPWIVLGSTAENKELWFDHQQQWMQDHGTFEGGTGAFVKEVTERNAAVIVSDMYAAPTELASGFGYFVHQNNNYTLELWLYTYRSTDSRDLEAYRSWFEIDSVQALSDSGSGRTLEITVTQRDNADKNRIGDPTSPIAHATPIDGRQITFIVVTEVVDGVERIISDAIQP